MENKFTNIKFESDKKVSPNTVTKIISASEDEPTLIHNLMKTKNFSKVVIRKHKDALSVIATGDNKRFGFEVYPSKYRFLGLRCSFPFLNVTDRLDNFFVRVGTDLPSYDFDNAFLAYFKSSLFYKQSIKCRYTRNLWGSGPLLKVDLGKTAKSEDKHIGFNITATNLLTFWGNKIDMQLKNRITSNRFSEVDYDTMIKLKYNNDNIDYETIPMGGKFRFKFIHSVLTTNLYKFKAEFNIQRFFYSIFLPKYSNLEVNINGLATNDQNQELGNLRGFMLPLSCSTNRYQATVFGSLKYNYFNIKTLMDKDINPFVFASGRISENTSAEWELGAGFQKIFKDLGTLEVLLNYRQQNLQLRFEPL